MKVVLAGAFGKLGSDILKELVKQGHEVIALDLIKKDIPEISGKYTAIQIDVTKPETLKGVMNGAEAIISTVGLTGTSATVTNYDIDLNGNLKKLKKRVSNTSVMFLSSRQILIHLYQCCTQKHFLKKN